MTTLIQPVNGVCVTNPTCWGGCGACSLTPFALQSSGEPAGAQNETIQFAGRSQVGMNNVCAGTDIYVTTFVGGLSTYGWYVDVWAAHAAGVWTSSTTIKWWSHYGTFPPPSYDISRYMAPDRTLLASFGACDGNTTSTAFCCGNNCALTNLITVTINDDGTWSYV